MGKNWSFKLLADPWMGFVKLAACFCSFVLIICLMGAIGDEEIYLCQIPDECQKIYDAAVMDAATIEADEIETIASLEQTKDITVVTWTSASYEQLLHKLNKSPIWVTKVPDLAVKCQSFKLKEPEQLKLRLNQLLGLTPNSHKSHFIEMKINTRDLLRPCVNPDPHQNQCSIALIPQEQKLISQLHPQYIEWFNKTASESYNLPGGYPWTRLGYTYDWNPKTPEFGVTEYLIRKQANTVRFLREIPTEKYCQK